VTTEAIQRSQFEADAAFVARMEASLPAGAAVYQLPYAAFPESPPVEKMGAYEHFRPYLHAKSLRFSHGSTRGRADDRWHQQIRELPTDEFVTAILQAGFSGIYIDRRGYADGAKGLETELAAQLKQQALVSGTGQQSFFVLAH
jgi:phosphoglycerol transferase